MTLLRRGGTAAAAIRGLGVLALAVLAWTQVQRETEWAPILELRITDAESGAPVAARFSLLVDGEEHEPRWVGAHGLRFVSVHVSKRQTSVVTYGRGTGPVEVPLRAGAREVTVRVAKGFDYEPAVVTAAVSDDPVEVAVELRRTNRLREDGWRAADTHVHYDRTEPAADRDWFDAMEGDGLTHAQFMMLKGGMVPGIWARQYAYGKAGEGTEGEKLIVPGEEYRDTLQGHILLFGMAEVIEPIMAGRPDAPENWPLFVDVLERARRSGGLAGVAHGASLGSSPTGLADAVLGKLDFMEIGNLFIWEPGLWYRLMNCGVHLPPLAGSDLPNWPYRDEWQPFLGSIRTYVRVGDERGSEAWNEAVRRGEVFVTSGPVVEFTVDGQGPGATIHLPGSGGEVTVEAALSSPRRLQSLELIRNGEVVASAPPGEGRLAIRTTVRITESCWLAARGEGARIEVFERNSVAHTGAVRVLVGGSPISSDREAAGLIEQLRKQREFYEANGRYGGDGQKQQALGMFDQAIRELETR